MAFTNTLNVGTYSVKVTFKYLGETKTSANITVHVKQKNTSSTEGTEGGTTGNQGSNNNNPPSNP